MSQSFSFPPPPPPPPKTVQNDQNSFNQQHGFADSYRPRGDFGGSHPNGRGRGNRDGSHYHPRGSQRGSYRGNRVDIHRGSRPTHPSTSFHQQYQSHADSRKDLAHSARKRNHDTAFHNPRSPNAANSRPLAPPPVPSFGVDLDKLLPEKPSSTSKGIEPSKKQNILGLTPVSREEDSESDDEGEEVRLSSTVAITNILQFEHRGQTSTLNTAAEIAAWIAERRKKWPTEAKREVAKKEAEERKKKQEAERAAKLEVSRIAAKARQEERQKQRLQREKDQVRRKLIREQIQKAKTLPTSQQVDAHSDNAPSSAQLRAEKLRRKAEKIALQLEKAERHLQKQDRPREDFTNADKDLDLETLLAKIDHAAEEQSNGIDPVVDGSINSDISSEHGTATVNDDNETSSSGSSSNSDDDSFPEELSSKRSGPERVHQLPRKAVPDTRPLCNNFARYGRCKYGRKCHYRHEKRDQKAMAGKESSIGNRRKGLYQVMVEKEQEEERRRALQVIVELGNAGLLDDPAPAATEAESKLIGG